MFDTFPINTWTKFEFAIFVSILPFLNTKSNREKFGDFWILWICCVFELAGDYCSPDIILKMKNRSPQFHEYIIISQKNLKNSNNIFINKMSMFNAKWNQKFVQKEQKQT